MTSIKQQRILTTAKTLREIPSFEEYCTKLSLDVKERGLHINSAVQLFRAIYENDVGLCDISQAFSDSKLIQEAGEKVLEVYYLELSENEKRQQSGDGGSPKWKMPLIIGASVVAGIGAVVAAPLVIAAAGFTSGGIAAGSFGAWLMSTYGGAVASGSLCAILQSAGAVGLSAGASAGIGLASASVAGTTMGVFVSGLTSDSSKTKGVSDYCANLVDRNLITSGERIKLVMLEKVRNRKVALQTLFNMLLKKNIGLKTLRGDERTLQLVEEIVTNVFNELLEDMRKGFGLEANSESGYEANSDHHKDKTNGSEFLRTEGKLCILASVAGLWSAFISPAVLSAFAMKSDGAESVNPETAKLFIYAVLCSLFDKIKTKGN